jgi:hypothetical protein
VHGNTFLKNVQFRKFFSVQKVRRQNGGWKLSEFSGTKNACGNCVHACTDCIFPVLLLFTEGFPRKIIVKPPNAFCRRLFRHLFVSPVSTRGHCSVFFQFLLCQHRVLHCDLFTYWSLLFAICSSLASFKQPTLSHLSHTYLVKGWQRRLIAHAYNTVHSRMLTVSARTCLLNRSLAAAVSSCLLRICCLATDVVPLSVSWPLPRN